MTESNRINVAREFALAVKRAGGEVLDEVLVQPDFANADYLFRSESVIAELKCLDEDKTADPRFREKLSGIYRRLMNEGRAPVVFGRGQVSLQQIAKIDETTAFEFMDAYKDRLHPLVKKANQQIKETAARLSVPNARGLLLLVNDGDMAFEVDAVLHVLARLLKAHFRSIHGVIYFTVNETVSVPGHHPAARIWVPLDVGGRPAISDSFHQGLFDAWANHMATITGEPVLAKHLDGNTGTDVGQVKLTNGRQVGLRL